MADKKVYDCLLNKESELLLELEKIEARKKELYDINMLKKLKNHYFNILKDNVYIQNYSYSYILGKLCVQYVLEYGLIAFNIKLNVEGNSWLLDMYDGISHYTNTNDYIKTYACIPSPCDQKVIKILKITCMLFSNDTVKYFMYPF